MCYYITYTATNCDTNKTWNDKAMIDYKSANSCCSRTVKTNTSQI